jgi:hypothetical protein
MFVIGADAIRMNKLFVAIHVFDRFRCRTTAPSIAVVTKIRLPQTSAKNVHVADRRLL